MKQCPVRRLPSWPLAPSGEEFCLDTHAKKEGRARTMAQDKGRDESYPGKEHHGSEPVLRVESGETKKGGDPDQHYLGGEPDSRGMPCYRD